MDKILYSYWDIWYCSCEGRNVHCSARTPIDWEKYQVEDALYNIRGGMGDDLSEIISVEEGGSENYSYDFT